MPRRKLAPNFTSNPTTPAIVAEKLLKTVLPDDLYLELTATGQFTFEINDHKYTLKRNGKTVVEMEGGKSGKRTTKPKFSCCIDVTDTSRPDQDRIVAEYLLIINDEKKYLKIANLTQIGGGLRGYAINYRWMDEAPNYIGYLPRRGQPPPTRHEAFFGYDTILPDHLNDAQDALNYSLNARTADRTHPERLHISQLGIECMRQITQHDRMRGLRFRRMDYGQCINPNTVNAEQFYDPTFHRNERDIVEFIYRGVIPPLVEHVVQELLLHPIIGVWGNLRYRPDINFNMTEDPQTGLVIMLIDGFDVVQRLQIIRLAIGIERPRIITP